MEIVNNFFGKTLAATLLASCFVVPAFGKEKVLDAADISARQDRLEARSSIENLMGRVVFYRLADLEHMATPLFANGDPDLKIQIPPGIFIGGDAAERVFGNPATAKPRARPGEMHYHTLVSPVIEVAGDGKTAKALWMSPGAVAQVRGEKAEAKWAWTKYAVDFKKINGEWKIWHFLVKTVFDSPYQTAWIDVKPKPLPASKDMPKPPPGMPKADRPNNDPGGYSLSTVQTLDPLPPLPYESWDESLSYIQ